MDGNRAAENDTESKRRDPILSQSSIMQTSVGGGNKTDLVPGYYEINIVILIVLLVLFIVVINKTDHVPGHGI